MHDENRAEQQSTRNVHTSKTQPHRLDATRGAEQVHLPDTVFTTRLSDEAFARCVDQCQPWYVALRWIRQSRNLRQIDVAMSAGFSESYVSRIEHGGRGTPCPPPWTLLRILTALNVPELWAQLILLTALHGKEQPGSHASPGGQ